VRDQVERIGLAVAAATQDLVPADKRLYALRDVTGTVSSPALIASSVMSKKLAGGAAHVLLDVKTGDGAFMQREEDAIGLAELCVSIGEAHGRRTGALVTDMSQPLGDGVGNAIEVAVAIETLRGERHGRFRDLCLDLAAAALELTGVEARAAHDQVTQLLDDGSAKERFREFVVAQGGDGRRRRALGGSPSRAGGPGVGAPAGSVAGFACRRVGELAGRLGAGRQRQGDPVDPAVGLEVLVRTGDELDGSAPRRPRPRPDRGGCRGRPRRAPRGRHGHPADTRRSLSSTPGSASRLADLRRCARTPQAGVRGPVEACPSRGRRGVAPVAPTARCGPSGALHEPPSVGLGDGLGAGLDPELLVDARQVVLDRLDGQEQPGRDLAGRCPSVKSSRISRSRDVRPSDEVELLPAASSITRLATLELR
jgi:hypothetical protein